MTLRDFCVISSWLAACVCAVALTIAMVHGKWDVAATFGTLAVLNDANGNYWALKGKV